MPSGAVEMEAGSSVRRTIKGGLLDCTPLPGDHKEAASRKALGPRTRRAREGRSRAIG